MFLNGRLNRRLAGAMGSDQRSYMLHLGQLTTATSSRQFVGAIDEVAVYLRALDDATVRGHYDAMFGRDQLN